MVRNLNLMEIFIKCTDIKVFSVITPATEQITKLYRLHNLIRFVNLLKNRYLITIGSGLMLINGCAVVDMSSILYRSSSLRQNHAVNNRKYSAIHLANIDFYRAISYNIYISDSIDYLIDPLKGKSLSVV